MSYSATEVVKGWRPGGVRYLLVCITAGVRYCACGRVDGAGRVGTGNIRSRGTNVQDGPGLSCGKEIGAVWVGSDTAAGTLGGSE